VLGDLAVDVRPERLPYALALSQSLRHSIEAGLKQPHLARVVHGHPGLEVTVLHLFERPSHGGQGIGNRPRCDERGQQPDNQCDRREEGRPCE
jgi:hypothetical protein